MTEGILPSTIAESVVSLIDISFGANLMEFACVQSSPSLFCFASNKNGSANT